MKNKLLLYLAGLLLLSSCAGTGLMKRRYTKGYYVSHSKSTKQPAVQETVPLTKAAVQAAPQRENVTPANDITTAPVLAPMVKAIPVSELAKAEQRYASAKNSPAALASAKSEPLVKASDNFRPLVMPSTAMNTQRTGDSSKVELLIMVILCLFPFINLIPVYLHDKGVTLNFWLTLILDFTLIGGVIFALLVILDIVNLAD